MAQPSQAQMLPHHPCILLTLEHKQLNSRYCKIRSLYKRVSRRPMTEHQVNKFQKLSGDCTGTRLPRQAQCYDLMLLNECSKIRCISSTIKSKHAARAGVGMQISHVGVDMLRQGLNVNSQIQGQHREQNLYKRVWKSCRYAAHYCRGPGVRL